MPTRSRDLTQAHELTHDALSRTGLTLVQLDTKSNEERKEKNKKNIQQKTGFYPESRSGSSMITFSHDARHLSFMSLSAITLLGQSAKKV